MICGIWASHSPGLPYFLGTNHRADEVVQLVDFLVGDALLVNESILGTSKNSNSAWNRDLFREQLRCQLISIQQSIKTSCRLAVAKNLSDPHRKRIFRGALLKVG